jgi:glycosyltransferase involved in cell wall biosynthesis
MRIAVWHNLHSGGGKRALHDQVRGLVARGHKVEAWCPPSADQTYLPLTDLVPEHVVPLNLRSAKSEASFLRKLHPRCWNAWTKLRAVDRHCGECARQIDAKGFDILFVAPCVFFRTSAIARFVKIPSLLYLQEPYRPFYESLPELPWLAMSWAAKDLLRARFWREALIHKVRLSMIRVLGREERRNALAFDEILVNSFFSRESVLRAYGIDSKVCYLGVDTEKFVNQNKRREPFALSVGALTPEKNTEFLIQSLGKVSATLRPKLVLIANMVDSRYLDEIRKLAGQLEVVFELKQRVEDTELVDTLNRARMMLYAPRLEPFGYAPLEANACGLPVIAVAEGGVRETIQEGINGILVEHDPQDMAGAIERLLEDHILHQRLSQQAAEHVRVKWSLQASIDRLERRLSARLGGGRRDVCTIEMCEGSVLSGANRPPSGELAIH